MRNLSDNYIQGPNDDIPNVLKFTLNGKRFLQYDSDLCAKSRFVIFFSYEFLSYIKNLTVVVIDRTFRSSPNQFYQLLTNQGYLFGRFIPLIFILLMGKSEEKYLDVFLHLKDNNILKPKVVITDYEITSFSALKVFDNQIKSYGCLFHYGQCLWRNIQHHGLEVHYKNDPDVKKILNQFLNLPYFKVERMKDAYEVILISIEAYPEKKIFRGF
ncbi:hypothetical protein DMUE_1774 [Dictyocoela muelleri]|nr:hypothetical protein DMUE_1774 [Dictyocoela muelleri]